MDRLFMIADDLTGALDAGVAFASVGIQTCVGRGDYFMCAPEAEPCAVHISVVESRHMLPEEAYRAVSDLLRQAIDRNYTWIYKKTDSALRGNIGAELTAILDTTGEKTLYFIPAFPQLGRITKDGIQYINGTTPVAESVFAEDPFNPVHNSAVCDVIAETCNTPCYMADISSNTYPAGIAVFNAETQQDIVSIGNHLTEQAGARLFAGCAGFASTLPALLQFERSAALPQLPRGRLMVFCGSVNPISLEQCEVAAAHGAPFFHLMDNGIAAKEDELAERFYRASLHSRITILNSTSQYVDGENAIDLGKQIAEKMSKIIANVTERGTRATPFIIGGDTLIAYIKNMEISSMIPLEEILPGVVLSKYFYHGEWRFLLSKSGGFGERDLLELIFTKLNHQSEELG